MLTEIYITARCVYTAGVKCRRVTRACRFVGIGGYRRCAQRLPFRALSRHLQVNVVCAVCGAGPCARAAAAALARLRAASGSSALQGAATRTPFAAARRRRLRFLFFFVGRLKGVRGGVGWGVARKAYSRPALRTREYAARRGEAGAAGLFLFRKGSAAKAAERRQARESARDARAAGRAGEGAKRRRKVEGGRAGRRAEQEREMKARRRYHTTRLRHERQDHHIYILMTEEGT